MTDTTTMTAAEVVARMTITFNERGFTILFDGEPVHTDVETIARTKEYLYDLIWEKSREFAIVTISGTVSIGA